MIKRKLIAFVIFLAAISPQFFISKSFGYAMGGWLEEKEGVKILHISGTNYEMGYQHGSLLRNETRENIRAFLSHCSNYDDLLNAWNITKNYIPQEYIEELHGIADGAEIKFEDVIVAYMSVVTWGMSCFGVSAWGNATADGKLYHFRSFDLPMNIRDPLTGKYVHENSVLIVRKPKNGYASVSPSFAGSLHGGGGFNEKGIAIGMQTCWSRDSTFYGTPEFIKVEMVLDHASNIWDGTDYLIKNSTAGWNFILSDCKIPAGYAIEVTANHSYVGTYDNLVESTPPFWGIKEVVRRTNFFISPEIAKTQRDHYDPSGISGFIRIFTENDIFFVIWRSYKVMSEMIEENYGRFDLNTSMYLFQSTYRGDSDTLLKILIKLAEGTSFNRAWNMWVACPETGDFVVSFAERDKIAFSTPYHYFNLFELI
ncbi:MAG: hypothetical protein H5T45_05935 [Thermoplasmatales archaeon]|nr:hypothetical protein [Thermoplasmatales archaeon]